MWWLSLCRVLTATAPHAVTLSHCHAVTLHFSHRCETVKWIYNILNCVHCAPVWTLARRGSRPGRCPTSWRRPPPGPAQPRASPPPPQRGSGQTRRPGSIADCAGGTSLGLDYMLYKFDGYFLNHKTDHTYKVKVGTSCNRLSLLAETIIILCVYHIMYHIIWILCKLRKHIFDKNSKR